MYLIQDQELLVVVNCLKDNQSMLMGQNFVVFTNHKALTYWSTKQLLSPRQIR